MKLSDPPPIQSAPEADSAELFGETNFLLAPATEQVAGRVVAPWPANPDEGASSTRSLVGWRRVLAVVWIGLVLPYRAACLVVLLAFVSTIPIIQLFTLGLFLDASARRSRGNRWGLHGGWLEAAGTIVTAAVVLFLASLPVRLLAHWAQAAELVDPGGLRSTLLRAAAIPLLLFVLAYIAWAWARGGRIRDYLWPAPRRFFREVFRAETWRPLPDRMWNLVAVFDPLRLFWLGFRCAVATLIWLAIPAMMLIGATRNGQTGLAGLVGVIGALLMAWVLLYLPFLQAEFAVVGTFRSMFGIRRIRQLFRRCPLTFYLALAVTLLFAVPLYLLKIEATPREVVWLPAILFVSMMLPARLVTGWVLAKAHRTADARTWYRFFARWAARLGFVPLMAVYLAVVYISQFTAWEGLSTWFTQHALLVPVPFAGI